RAGAGAALVATPLVVFLPDALAHAGVAYNDLPLALAYLGAVWALDVAVRQPSLRTGAAGGVLVVLAVGVKFSAVGLGPVALVLLALGGAARAGDRGWRADVARSLAAGVGAGWLALALVYRGDLTLSEFRWAFAFNVDRAA